MPVRNRTGPARRAACQIRIKSKEKCSSPDATFRTLSQRPLTTDSLAAAVERIVRDVLAGMARRDARVGEAAGESGDRSGGRADFEGRGFRPDEAARRGPDEASGQEPGVALFGGVVSQATVGRLPASTREIVVTARGVVTPAAVDEAKRRRISIRRVETGRAEPADSGVATDYPIEDRDRLGRAEAVSAGLTRRGIPAPSGVRIVLSDSPGRAVYEEIRGGAVAVPVRRLSDVDRFGREFDPTCWVLDMVDLDPVAALNAAQRICQRSMTSRRGLP